MLLFTLFTSRDTIGPSFIEGAMRKILILILFVFAMIFVAGCGVLAFRNRYPYADSSDPKSPAIIPEQPVVFGAMCGPFGYR